MELPTRILFLFQNENVKILSDKKIRQEFWKNFNIFRVGFSGYSGFLVFFSMH